MKQFEAKINKFELMYKNEMDNTYNNNDKKLNNFEIINGNFTYR